MSLPSRERELKRTNICCFLGLPTVAPFAGARVETFVKSLILSVLRAVAPFAGARVETLVQNLLHCHGKMSLPSRERELKQKVTLADTPILPVAPFAGARVETTDSKSNYTIQKVAPFAGARVETTLAADQ